MAKTSDAQKEASKKYERTMAQITLRVPKDAREEIRAYVEEKALEAEDKSMYVDSRGNASVNAFICNLIERETGINLKMEKQYKVTLPSGETVIVESHAVSAERVRDTIALKRKE